MKYVLLYNVDDYPEMDGGQHYKIFDTLEDMEKEAHRLLRENVGYTLNTDIVGIEVESTFDYKILKELPR